MIAITHPAIDIKPARVLSLKQKYVTALAAITIGSANNMPKIIEYALLNLPLALFFGSAALCLIKLDAVKRNFAKRERVVLVLHLYSYRLFELI